VNDKLVSKEEYHMYYAKPTARDKKDYGFVESFPLKDVQSLDVSIETVEGSARTISLETAKEDRIFYVLAGLGFARVGSREHTLEEDAVLEVPAGARVELSGQVKLLVVRSKA
jgi:mannose-6-phosphate isomerase-like protein (cupin superfamily)